MVPAGLGRANRAEGYEYSAYLNILRKTQPTSHEGTLLVCKCSCVANVAANATAALFRSELIGDQMTGKQRNKDCN